MYTIIIITIIVVTIIMWTYSYVKENVVVFLFRLFLSILVGIVVGGFFSLIITLIVPKETIYETQYIVAIKDNSIIEGQFFLGAGTIDEQSYYCYYRINSFGGITQHKIETNRAIIYEDVNTEQKPYIKVSRWVVSNEVWKNWTLPYFGFPRYIEIHIPKASIIQEFKLDLE